MECQMNECINRPIRDEELDAFFKAGYNVLLSGKHGVGKTAMIKSCFERNGLIRNESYLYFSTPTLDPWVDLVGVPKEVKGPDGKYHLDLVRPKSLANGNIVAVFFDEYNRSVKKIRNAVMELMQFKSINGMVLPNLKVVWAAVNPDSDEETYDVEKIDPAQQDRFHTLPINIPYECCREYFVQKYGNHTAVSAIEWWANLPDDVKNFVSPRRLDYALEAYGKNLPLEFILPVSSNVLKLQQALRTGPVEEKLLSFMKSNDTAGAKLWLANNNNYSSSVRFFLENQDMMKFFLPLSPKEQLTTLIASNDKILNFVCTAASAVPVYRDLLTEIMKAHENNDLQKKLRIMWGRNITKTQVSTTTAASSHAKPADNFFNKEAPSIDIKKLQMIDTSSVAARQTSFNTIKQIVPENMTSDQAFAVLDAIHNIVSNAFPSSLCQRGYDKLTGVINHCLLELQKRNGFNNVPAPAPNDLVECWLHMRPDHSITLNKLRTANLLDEIVH